MKDVTLILGSGGVGKTTVAAAMGLARSEKTKGALFTVDPSLRLCQTLGLEKLSLTPSILMNGNLEAYGLEIEEGLRLLLTKVLGDPERVARITSHRLFNIIEGNISHLDHFLAIDKIVELLDRTDLNFLIVDTPPHDQAFEFFESPRVLANFLDKAFLKVLLNSKLPDEGMISKFFGRALEEGWKVFRSLLGENFWEELATLLQELLPLRERLLYSAEKMDTLLRDKKVKAVLVTIPETKPFEVAQNLSVEWESKLGVKVETLILNRAFPQESPPENLKGTLLYDKWNLQRNLVSKEWFKGFKNIRHIDPLSPMVMGIGQLKEIGNGIA